jgi:trehalose 6-phosphate synthase
MPLIDRLLSDWLRGDIQLRSEAVMQNIGPTVQRLLESGDANELAQYLNRVNNNEHLIAIITCDASGTVQTSTAAAPRGVTCTPLGTGEGRDATRVVDTSLGSVQISQFPLDMPSGARRTILLAYDSSFMDRRGSILHEYIVAFVLVGAVALSLLFVLAGWWSFKRWVLALVSDIRGRRFLEDATSAGLALPLLTQFRQVLREVEASQRLEIEYQENWTPTALQHVVREFLESPELLVISNREPYIHSFDADGQVRVQVPASGMVTALEPIMKACAGTWIAHGSGDADRSVVDRRARIGVPPTSPSYQLRRVWLTKEQEAGYYYGLSNEGLWPLCHLAYVRPEFRASDWQQYVDVNRKFAEAATEEIQGTSPVVLIQDYHFALLPAELRKRCADATIVLFWHIPWPNAETFGVCPWKRELISGMLQADILGFHTRYHCQNFLDAVDRFVEGQIDKEHMTVTIRGHKCQIAAYPISIEWPSPWEASTPSAEDCRRIIRSRYAIPEGAALGLGVERWDFTKGILERFGALKYLLETRPKLRGRVTLLQIVAPSRSKLPAYQALQERTIAVVDDINRQFSRDGWQPIILVPEHQEAPQVFELYRAADFCLVNSLHDGMNLVAKEFVAARDDEDGVLILSTFAGASRELLEALLVNPYDPIETAAAIEVALQMDRAERRERMQLMRRTVKQNNVYRWAGRILVDAAQIRQRQRLERHTQHQHLRNARVASA